MEKFDFDAELKKCEAIKRDDEVIAYTVASGRITPFLTDKKEVKRGMKKAMDMIQKMDGFLGIHPVDIWRTLFVFDSVNHAKICKNILTKEGVSTGNNICPILVNKAYIKE